MLDAPYPNDILIACALHEPALAACIAALEREVFAAVEDPLPDSSRQLQNAPTRRA